MDFLFKITFIDVVDTVFSIGLFLNAILFIPQVLSIIRSKSAEGVSLFTFIGFNVMQVFTILHGYFSKDYILMTGFILSFITCSPVTYLALKYRKSNRIKVETERLGDILIN